ncbi:MAG TPA: glycosyltransferase, partial [Flavobacteriales bacterium]|nr:glycosyltransferase [Flavobacteriales bacterium]
GWIARKLRKHTKVIAIVDNIIPHEQKIGDAALIRYFVNSCDAFVAMSQSVLDDLGKFTNTERYKFLPHPIYDIFGEKITKLEARVFLDLKAEARYILFFGFIRKYKGLDLLLHAMADSRIRELNIKLIIAGEFYGNEAYYKEIIRENELEDELILKTHYIASEEVKHYFCAADIIVQPYKTATQSGITQIAYNFERPMLVTNTGGLAEIVPDNKVGYVTETNATAIADALVDFYSNAREAEFSSNTIEEKKRFTWSVFVQGVQELAFNE